MLQTCRTLGVCPRLLRQLHNETTPSPEPTPAETPNYRYRADQVNNPYREQFTYGRKPRTFKERYIESKKNEPKPKIGHGDRGRDYLDIKRSDSDRKTSFFKNELRCRFSDLGITPELSRQVAELGVVHPTYHQSDVIPELLKNKNCVFISPTGSGKTYSYLLPTIQSLLQSKKEGYITRSQAPRIIVMAPTKFLAIQLSEVVEHLTQDLQLRSECLASMGAKSQERILSGAPVDILIGTYNNIMSHVGAGTVSTTDLQHLVIDEVEGWLDYRDVEDNMPFLAEFVDYEKGTTKCQVVLTGAILPEGGFKRLRDVIPDIQQYLNPLSHIPLSHIQQNFNFVNNNNKPQHFVDMIKTYVEKQNMNFQRPLIFCNFKNTAYWLHKHLISEGVDNIILSHFANRRDKDALIRTEIPSTQYPIIAVDSVGYGLDFRDIGLVVNYEFPFTYEDYLRRVGRTGRISSNSNHCEAISYVSHNRDKALFNIIKNSIDSKQCKAYSLLSPNKFGWVK